MLFGSHVSYLVFQCLLMALSFSLSHWWTLIQLTSKQPTPLTLQDLWHLYFPNAWIIALMRAFPSTRTFCRTCSSDTFSDWTTTVCQGLSVLCTALRMLPFCVHQQISESVPESHYLVSSDCFWHGMNLFMSFEKQMAWRDWVCKRLGIQKNRKGK